MSIFSQTQHWIDQVSKSQITFLALTSLGVIALIDYLVGAEISVLLLYLLPVFLVTWRMGFRAGLAMSLLCAVAWGLLFHLQSSHATIEVSLVNFLIKLGVFVCFSYAYALIGADLAAQRELNQQLQAALAEVDRLSGLLPICANCKRIHAPDGRWENIESYISGHSEAQFSHSICPECVQKLYPQYSRPKP